MANWQNKVNLVDLKEQYENEEISIEQMANQVADRLETLKPLKFTNLTPKEDKEYLTEMLDRVIEELRMAEDEDDFNYALNDIYDWGDIDLDTQWPRRKLCWIGFAF